MSLIVILLITAVHARRTTVDDRLLFCTEICTADKLFTKGHNELGFENYRVCTVAVFLIHIHCIDMARRSGRDIDDFTAECLYNLRIFSLRVDDNNICIGGKNDIFNLSLCYKGFTTAGYAEDKGITVKELSAVGDNHIFADNILTVVNAVLVVNVLNTERNKYRKAFRSQGSESVNLSRSKWH